jgi:predicted Rossmann fold nucleotide-binding protein DprA/Smf involved in DNA uptake
MCVFLWGPEVNSGPPLLLSTSFKKEKKRKEKKRKGKERKGKERKEKKRKEKKRKEKKRKEKKRKEKERKEKKKNCIWSLPFSLDGWPMNCWDISVPPPDPQHQGTGIYQHMQLFM